MGRGAVRNSRLSGQAPQYFRGLENILISFKNQKEKVHIQVKEKSSLHNVNTLICRAMYSYSTISHIPVGEGPTGAEVWLGLRPLQTLDASLSTWPDTWEGTRVTLDWDHKHLCFHSQLVLSPGDGRASLLPLQSPSKHLVGLGFPPRGAAPARASTTALHSDSPHLTKGKESHSLLYPQFWIACLCPPYSCVEAPTPSAMVLGNGALERVIRI